MIKYNGKTRAKVIREVILPAIFYEYTEGIWTREEALVLLNKWYNVAKSLGRDLAELEETYQYYKEMIEETVL